MKSLNVLSWKKLVITLNFARNGAGGGRIVNIRQATAADDDAILAFLNQLSAPAEPIPSRAIFRAPT